MTDERRREVVPVKLTDNDILLMLQSAELNAGSRGSSIYQKQIYSALKELYDSHVAKAYVESIP